MNAVCSTHRRAVGVLCGLLLAQPFAASAGATAGFLVAVNLGSTSQGTCLSEPLGEPTDFQVTCTSGQFVSMSPRSTLSFAGTPGGTYRYHLVPGTPGFARPTRRPALREPPATVTAMQVSSGSASPTEPVEILVSF